MLVSGHLQHTEIHLLNSSGNGLNVVKVMPESAIKFGAYEVSLAKEPKGWLQF